MLPLGMLSAAKRQQILVEVKSGETFNGTLSGCDVWMNLSLTDVVRTSADGESFLALQQAFVRGPSIKYVRLPDTVIDSAKEYNRRQQALRRARNAAQGRNPRTGRPATNGGGNSSG